MLLITWLKAPARCSRISVCCPGALPERRSRHKVTCCCPGGGGVVLGMAGHRCHTTLGIPPTACNNFFSRTNRIKIRPRIHLLGLISFCVYFVKTVKNRPASSGENGIPSVCLKSVKDRCESRPVPWRRKPGPVMPGDAASALDMN